MSLWQLFADVAVDVVGAFAVGVIACVLGLFVFGVVAVVCRCCVCWCCRGVVGGVFIL